MVNHFREDEYLILYGMMNTWDKDKLHSIVWNSHEFLDAEMIAHPSCFIAKKLYDDLGLYVPNNGYLTKWASQGVLMLNTVLTVRAHQANSHKGIGWEQFTDAAIKALNEQDRPVVYMLWGAPAGRKQEMLNNKKQLVLTAPHPSPLSAYRGFFGCKHFSICNNFLRNNGIKEIDWQIENI